jgi:hypothetical protein
MKAATLAFLGTLLVALSPGGTVELYHLPLSMFRDGPLWFLGYTLFALLMLIGSLMAVALIKTGRHADAGFFIGGVLLLAVIACTPSADAFHLLCSFLLLFLLYSYYALRLYLAESRWRVIHWVMPLVMVAATGCQSYGLWQKGFIAYCVLAIAIHHHLLGRGAPKPWAPRAWGPAPPLRKRVVYVVEDGEAWDRR